METGLHTAQAIQDIEPPLAPPLSNLPAVIFLLALTLLLVTLTTLAVRHFNSRRSQAIRKLRSLRKKVENNDTTRTFSRGTAFRLARTLAPGLGLNGITTTTPLPADLNQHQDRWQKFLNTLSHSRFANHVDPTSDKNKMFADALFWLKKWP